MHAPWRKQRALLLRDCRGNRTQRRARDYFGVAFMTVDCRANRRQSPFSKRKTSVKRLSRVFSPCTRPSSLFGFGFTISRPITIPTLPVIAVASIVR